MNWLLPAVLLFLLIAAGDGHRKGFIKKSVGLVSWGVTFLVTSIGVPYIADFLKEKTELKEVSGTVIYKQSVKNFYASLIILAVFTALFGITEMLSGN